MKERSVFVFPGQGAQYVGMGAGLYKEYPAARYAFEAVSDATHRDMAKICFSGPAAHLNTPAITSLGTFAHSVAIVRVIEAHFGCPLYDIAYVMVGHSLGQYSALHAVDSIDLYDAARLVSLRSLYMSMGRGDCGMAAIVGLSKEQVENLLFLAVGRGFAAISNHNAHDQFILSGENAALDAILGAARAHGARIARRLNISVPAHCALMAPAAIKMRQHLEQVEIRQPKTNWFSNQTASLMWAPYDIRHSLVEQMTCGVRWAEIMDKFPAMHITRAYEIGPGATLTRLIARTHSGIRTMHTDSVANVRAVIDAIEKDMAGAKTR